MHHQTSDEHLLKNPLLQKKKRLFFSSLFNFLVNRFYSEFVCWELISDPKNHSAFFLFSSYLNLMQSAFKWLELFQVFTLSNKETLCVHILLRVQTFIWGERKNWDTWTKKNFYNNTLKPFLTTTQSHQSHVKCTRRRQVCFVRIVRYCHFYEVFYTIIYITSATRAIQKKSTRPYRERYTNHDTHFHIKIVISLLCTFLSESSV